MMARAGWFASAHSRTADSPAPRSQPLTCGSIPASGTVWSQVTVSRTRAASSECARTSRPTDSGTWIGVPGRVSRSIRPARDRTISGDALTTSRSATAEFRLELGEVDLDGVQPAAGQLVEELQTGHACDLGGLASAD